MTVWLHIINGKFKGHVMQFTQHYKQRAAWKAFLQLNHCQKCGRFTHEDMHPSSIVKQNQGCHRICSISYLMKNHSKNSLRNASAYNKSCTELSHDMCIANFHLKGDTKKTKGVPWCRHFSGKKKVYLRTMWC